MGAVWWTVVVLSAVGVAGQLWARWCERRWPEAALKLATSALFLLLVGVLTASRPPGPATWISVGLVASFVGDAFLLGQAKRWIALGLVAFLLAHLAYLAASLPLVDLGRVSPLGLSLVLSGALIAGVLTVAEARVGLGRLYLPAALYTTALGAMTVVAVCAWLSAPTRPGRAALAAGGVLFLISDVSVARQRFSGGGFSVRLWGLPCYYAAQLLFATAASRL